MKYQHTWINYSNPVRTTFKTAYIEIGARVHPGLVVYPNDRVAFFEFFFTYDRKDIQDNDLADFSFYYDLFTDNIRGITAQKMTVPGDDFENRITERSCRSLATKAERRDHSFKYYPGNF